MAKKINEKEFTSVVHLAAPERYTHFIKRVADRQEVWSLYADGGWALVGDDNGNELVPVWPHEEYAVACAKDKWTGYRPQVIELRAWMKRWIPGMIKDKRNVAVFPTPSMQGVHVSPERLKNDLEAELALIE